MGHSMKHLVCLATTGMVERRHFLRLKFSRTRPMAHLESIQLPCLRMGCTVYLPVAQHSLHPKLPVSLATCGKRALTTLWAARAFSLQIRVDIR